MHLSILGTGAVGSRLGQLFALAGHSVYFGSRNPQRARTALGAAVQVGSYAEAVQTSNIVVIATPWANDATAEALRAAESLAGKIAIDCTNPLAPDYLSNILGHTTSAAEEIAKMLPQAKVVKAFNTIFASNLQPGKQTIGSETITGFYCGDDAAAKQTVADLIADAGFEPMDVGELKNARYLEPMAQLNIQIAYRLGYGTDVAFKYLCRAARPQKDEK